MTAHCKRSEAAAARGLHRPHSARCVHPHPLQRRLATTRPAAHLIVARWEGAGRAGPRILDTLSGKPPASDAKARGYIHTAACTARWRGALRLDYHLKATHRPLTCSLSATMTAPSDSCTQHYYYFHPSATAQPLTPSVRLSACSAGWYQRRPSEHTLRGAKPAVQVEASDCRKLRLCVIATR